MSRGPRLPGQSIGMHNDRLGRITSGIHDRSDEDGYRQHLNVCARCYPGGDVISGDVMALIPPEGAAALGKAATLRDTYGYALSNYGWRFLSDTRYQQATKEATSLICSQSFKQGLRDAFFILEQLAPEATILGDEEGSRDGSGRSATHSGRCLPRDYGGQCDSKSRNSGCKPKKTCRGLQVVAL